MDYNQACHLTINVVKRVGEFILAEAGKFNREKVSDKGLNQLVSYVDITAEQMLVEGLKGIIPEAGFITEEETAGESGGQLQWIIDPLDGTTNFIHGLPVYSISVALVNGPETVIGVVLELNRNECFHAFKGGGAFLNDERISVSPVSGLDNSLLATGFPYYDFGMMERYLNVLKVFMQKTHGLRRLGSAAVDLAYVACGRFEGFFEYSLSPWDVAAGALIVQEAGGVVTDFSGDGNYVFGKEIVASCKGIQPEFLDVIRSNFKN